MKAMILAAGAGSRLRPFTDNVPKPMISIAGKPILEYTIDWLRRYGIIDVMMNLHYLPDTIKNHFGDGADFGVNITYSYENELLGTAGAVKNVQDFFEDTFILIYGDNLTDLKINNMIEFHHKKGGLATIALFKRENSTASGVVAIDYENKIIKFIEKPDKAQIFSNLVNAAIYILEPDIFNDIPANRFYDFGRELFPKLLNNNKNMYGYLMDEKLFWIDTVQDYNKLQDDIEKRRFALS